MQRKLINGNIQLAQKTEIVQGKDWFNHLILNLRDQGEQPTRLVLNNETLDTILCTAREKVFFYPEAIVINTRTIINSWDPELPVEPTPSYIVGPVHIVEGPRYAPQWSVLDDLSILTFSKYRFGLFFEISMAVVSGTRSGTRPEDKVFIVDITDRVTKRGRIQPDVLCDSIFDMSYYFHQVVRGDSQDRTAAIVIKPTPRKHGGGDTYAVYYVTAPAAVGGLIEF